MRLFDLLASLSKPVRMQKGPQCSKLIVKWNKQYFTCPERIKQAEEIAYNNWSLHCVIKKKDCIPFISD